MGFENTRAVLEKPTALQIALPTSIPIVIAFCATSGTMLFGERYGWHAVLFELVGWCVLLFGSAVWLNQALFHRVKTLLPFMAAIAAILSIWLWQKQAFTALAPSSGLTYGYFLRPEGAQARFWVLACPFWAGVACLMVCFVAALVLGWRSGTRRSLACMVPWWFAALVIFSLPSMYLDGQGNASIFI